MFQLFIIFVCVLFCNISLHNTANAIRYNEDPVLSLQCTITPAIWQLQELPPIYKTNNLRKRVGSCVTARGIPITIRGRVLSQNCSPLTGAVVRIWQRDSYGHYNTDGQSSRYLNDSILYDHEDHDTIILYKDKKDKIENKYDINFTGSGTAISDNMGYFRFYTIIPGIGEKNELPNIKFHVSHKSAHTLETQIFLNYVKNMNDIGWKSVKGSEEFKKETLVAKQLSHNEQSNEMVYDINIVLKTI